MYSQAGSAAVDSGSARVAMREALEEPRELRRVHAGAAVLDDDYQGHALQGDGDGAEPHLGDAHVDVKLSQLHRRAEYGGKRTEKSLKAERLGAQLVVADLQPRQVEQVVGDDLDLPDAFVDDVEVTRRAL